MPILKKTKFYKDIKIVKRCKKCGVPFRPARYSYHLGLCIVCRREFIKFSRPSWKESVAKMTPERREEFMEKEYLRWQKWVNAHIDRRRYLALKSYHQRKYIPSNRARSHHKKKTAV